MKNIVERGIDLPQKYWMLCVESLFDLREKRICYHYGNLINYSLNNAREVIIWSNEITKEEYDYASEILKNYKR